MNTPTGRGSSRGQLGGARVCGRTDEFCDRNFAAFLKRGVVGVSREISCGAAYFLLG
jgi:hypothetical protein